MGVRGRLPGAISSTSAPPIARLSNIACWMDRTVSIGSKLLLRLRGASCITTSLAAELSSESRMSGMHGAAEDAPDMHFTATVDLCTVIEGSVVLCLDDGHRVTLERGDCLVQQGTRHSWRNPGSTTALVATAVIGVPHDGAAH